VLDHDDSRDAPVSAPVRRPDAVSGTLLALGALFLFLSGQALLAPLGLAGLGASQWLFLALPVVVGLRVGGFDLAESLALRRTSVRSLVGAALVMFGALGVNSVVAWLQSFWIPVPVEVAEALGEVLDARTPAEVLLVLAVAALTPAICEEGVFRGALLQGWRRAPAAVAIGVNAALFGAIHWMPGTAFRILPAATSGAFIAWAVWRTRSLWTGVWMHALNNGVLVMAAVTAGAVEDLPGAEAGSAAEPSAPSVVAVVVIVVILIAGGRLLDDPATDVSTSRPKASR
jgi:membrane protease YdiL (CAAX protease family)